MVSSGLKGNVVLNKPYVLKMAQKYVQSGLDTGAKGIGTPLGRGPYQCECVPHAMWHYYALNSTKKTEVLEQKPSIYLKGTALQPNISREEAKALKGLRENKSRVILTADKGVAMVVLNKEDYFNKAQDLLVYKYTYILITEYPNIKQKNKLIQFLRSISVRQTT